MSEASAQRERERPPPAPVHFVPEVAPPRDGPVQVHTQGANVTGPMLAAQRLLAIDDVGARLARGDATLWGPDAEPEAKQRLGWLHAVERSRPLLAELAALRASCQADGLRRVVLCGMGGSSLAPEVICRAAGVALDVLDTTDPGQVAAVLSHRLTETVFVVASKSGSTVETASHLAAALAALRDAGVTDPWRQVVVVTDPGSPLELTARTNAARAVVLADPEVGGRYSALSAFGLTPSALAGADVAALLDDAAAVTSTSAGVALGAALGGLAVAGRTKVVIADTGMAGLGDWIEQLLAESTGKNGRGLLPVVVESPTAPGTKVTVTNDVHLVVVGGQPKTGTGVSGPLGAQFLVWEQATAVASRLLGVNPFDQPDVESAKHAARESLGGPPLAADFVMTAQTNPAAALGFLGRVVAAVPSTGYLAVLAYLDRPADAALSALRPALAARTTRSVTFGWGPRYLHSTGQYHKGGPPNGVFLQITGAVVRDLPVPGQPFTLGQLQRAQADGDAGVLRARGCPVFRVHLRERAAGITALLGALALA